MSPDLRVHALVSEAPDLGLPRLLRAVFSHPWVASYQIGFGPPLLRATPRLTERAKAAPSALDKLDVYLDYLLTDDADRRRMADRVRLIALNRAGRLDAELLDRANDEALDLSVRLHAPAQAPPAVKRAMLESGVSAAPEPPDEAPEALTARITVRLADLGNQGLLAWAAAGAAGWGLELWAPPPASALFRAYLADVAKGLGPRTASKELGSLGERWARIEV